ncbi:unnamed protein product [Sphagnum jensenii]|uniref:Uncharacterized protein n=1 Tax=Sphagnum jensenii TaxID=128206 RepID=A0ABP1BTH4_9BRYO
MAWSEDDVVESGSITVVDITTEGEVAPPVPVEIDDEEAQLEVDNAERGDIVAVWIKNFINAGIFPAIIKGAAFKDLKKMTSFLSQCDVRLIDKDKVEWFIYLLDPCFNVNKPVVIKCTKTGVSNACTHLDKKHCITSSKTMATNKKLADIKKQLDLSDPAFKKDPMRWFEVQLGAWSAEQSISYNAFTTRRWQLIGRQLPVGEGGMKSINIRVLEEFGIKVMLDVLTSTSDSRSDVKRTLDILIDAWWEWCISHLIHLALMEAFSTSIDPNNSKNVDARCFFQRIKKVIEAVNKSEYLQGAFEEAMLELLETYLKLLNSPQH